MIKKYVSILLLTVCAVFAFGGCGGEDENGSIALTGLSFSESSVSVAVSGEALLTLNTLPADANDTESVSVSVVDTSVARLTMRDSQIYVSGISVGTTKVIAMGIGGIKAEVSVNVLPSVKTGADFILQLRSSAEELILLGDVAITDADLALFGYDALLLKNRKKIIGNNYTVDMSGVTTLSPETGAVVITSYETVEFTSFTLVLPSAFSGAGESAVKDENGVLVKHSFTVRT